MKYKSTHIQGKGRGKDLGFPTINLKIPNIFVKKPGVYAGWIYLEDKKIPAAIHYGPIPVFSQKERSLEIHAIDYQVIDVPAEAVFSIIKYIRPVMSFSSPEELASQIKLDIHQIKNTLSIK